MLQKLIAEGVGTAMLLISVIGSGIMGAALSGGNEAIALLANAIATGCMLYVIITVLGPISGAHFNPGVTLAFYLRGDIAGPLALSYVAVQCTGGVLGVWATHAMFDMPIFQTSGTLHRIGIAQWWSEILATLGLLFVIFGGLKSRPEAVPTLVAFYITGAYWFTASTSFANPAVTLARGFSDTFAGIYPGHIPAFIIAQLLAVAFSHRLFAKFFA
ncbi:MAG: aquaporin [Pseudomonadota bacterium]